MAISHSYVKLPEGIWGGINNIWTCSKITIPNAIDLGWYTFYPSNCSEDFPGRLEIPNSISVYVWKCHIKLWDIKYPMLYPNVIQYIYIYIGYQIILSFSWSTPILSPMFIGSHGSSTLKISHPPSFARKHTSRITTCFQSYYSSIPGFSHSFLKKKYLIYHNHLSHPHCHGWPFPDAHRGPGIVTYIHPKTGPVM